MEILEREITDNFLMPFSLNIILTIFSKCLNLKHLSPTKLDGDRGGRCGQSQQVFL